MTEPGWKNKATSIFDEARKLWQKVSSQKRPAVPTARASTTESLSAIDIKFETLERRVTQLEEEAAASYDVVNSIAQQHSSLSEQHLQLIQAVEEQQASSRKLAWACFALALLALAAFAIAMTK